MSKGKFTLLIGDDDILLAKALKNIIKAIRDNETKSFIMINGYRSSSPEFRNTKAGLIFQSPEKISYFNNANTFLNSITLRAITFMSCMIFNTDILTSTLNLEEGTGSHFIQTYWLLKVLKTFPNSAIYPYPWILRGNAESRLTQDMDCNHNIIGLYSKDSTLIVHLEFYSLNLPIICKQLNYRILTARKLFCRYLISLSMSILYEKIKGNLGDIIKREIIYRYTKKMFISWAVAYPIIIFPETEKLNPLLYF